MPIRNTIKTIGLLAMLSTFTGHTALAQTSLWGITSSGGSNGFGTLFEYNPATGDYHKWFDFDNTTTGSSPRGRLLYANGKLWGMTQNGGANDAGVIYTFDPVSKTYAKKLDLSSSTGTAPCGGFTGYGGKLYGLTHNEGSFGGNGAGTLFEYDTTANTITVKANFQLSSGIDNPIGTLLEYNNLLYGLGTGFAMQGAIGTLFYYDPAAGTIHSVSTFDMYSGLGPNADVTLFNGQLYGTTTDAGGVNGDSYGSIFRNDPAGIAAISCVYDFGNDSAAFNGGNPNSDVTVVNGKLYGTNSSGGAGNIGVLYEYDPATGAYAVKHNFPGGQALTGPIGNLTLYNNMLYGCTRYDGANASGTIYSYDPATGIFTTVHDFDNTNGAITTAVDLMTTAPATPTAITDVTRQQAIKIWPVPAGNMLHVTAPQTNGMTLTLCDVTGRTQLQTPLQEGDATIATGALAPGVYTYRITDGQGALMQQGKVTKL